MKVHSGNTYLVYDNIKYWYIVKQIGQKSWRAFCFSHNDVPYNLAIFEGHSQNIVDKIYSGAVPIRCFSDRELRSKMFNILEKGHL